MKKIILLVVVTFFVNGLFAFHGGKRDGFHHRRGKGRMMNMSLMKERLNLSDSQLDKMLKIKTDFHKKSLYLREKLSPMHMKVKRELLEETINLKKIRGLFNQIASYRTDMRMLRIKHRIAVEKILTKKQLIKYKSFLSERGPRKNRGRKGRRKNRNWNMKD